jgi:hypothetical protein
MSHPAFQLISDRWSSTGAFGTAPFGTSPFGGEDWPPTALPRIHMTSDNLTRVLSRNVARIVHKRQGQTVSARTFTSWGVWRCAFVAITEAKLDELWVFCQAGVFRLLPTGDPGTYYTVYWDDQDFRPDYLGNGKYSISFTIEEVPA